MTTRRRSRPQPKEAGFTLAFTIMLTMVFSLVAISVMVRMYAGMRNASFSKTNQQLSDAATIGLTMALDELTPGLERMRNTVWSSYTTDATVSVLSAGYSLESNGTSTGQPLREFTLLGNIRNWEPFADWSKVNSGAVIDQTTCTSTDPNSWNKGWAYVPENSTEQSFDAGSTSSVMVGNTKTTGKYWYSQLQPSPPTMSVPVAPEAWRNGGVEYPLGAFHSPILKKVYTVRSNPLTRVAVYVRMSFQDYLNYDSVTKTFKNVNFRGKSPTDPNSASFDGSNFYKNCAVTFSIFAVSEPIWDKSSGYAENRGTRIHQALNIGIGGIEFVGGVQGIDTYVNTHKLSGAIDPPRFQYWTQPFFPPSLDTPRGDNALVAGTPITGQVYPASGDLSYNFSGRQATDSIVFLYEKIDLPNSLNPASPGVVVFLIERVPPNSFGATPISVCYRRRLLYDWPSAYTAPGWGEFTSVIFPGSTPSQAFQPGKGFDTIAWAASSYSIDATSDVQDRAWSSMGWFANKKAPFTGSNKWYYVPREEHFATDSLGFTALTDTAYTGTVYQNRYPFTEWISRTGNFTIATTSAPSAPTDFNVINWPNNPLMAWDSSTRKFSKTMAKEMPWEGPTIVNPARTATVSYFVSTWPYMTNQSYWWLAAGGRLGLSYGAAEQTFY